MTPDAILHGIYERAMDSLNETIITDESVRGRVDYVCRCISNRACARLFMSCMLAKIHQPQVDPRKPYTKIKGDDCFSGRTYDEQHMAPFIAKHQLPVNATTAFLTPALRNIDHPLTTDRELIGKPLELYKKTLSLLEDVAKKRIDADILLVETVRILLVMRDEKQARMNSLLCALSQTEGSLSLSSESIITLISQHLRCKNASRLPVLVVAAAYRVASTALSEGILPLHSHNAADLQTGSLGDVEICLIGEDDIITAYEMKMKRVTEDDIDAAVKKIDKASKQIDNYLFVTTDPIDPVVSEYAATFYERTNGTEIAILDCIGFVRHFLHLFHRLRRQYLNAYQSLLLREPDSAVNQPLKEAFLGLRHSAESGE